MTRDELIRMAREADPEFVGYRLLSPLGAVDFLERFANLIAAAEREACAKVCDEQMEWGIISPQMKVSAGNCADLIRARGKNE